VRQAFSEISAKVKAQRSPARDPGRGLVKRTSVAVLPRSRPEEGVAFAAFVVEQVRVDWRVEGGIVEFEREVVATFLGALRPGCADFGPAHEDAVAGRVLVGRAVLLGDDANSLGLQAQGDDLALEAVLGQLATVFLK